MIYQDIRASILAFYIRATILESFILEHLQIKGPHIRANPLLVLPH